MIGTLQSQILRLLIHVAIFLFVSGSVGEGLSAAIIPDDLRCENMAAPLGIDNANPRLSWIVKSDMRDQRQSAYHILMASSIPLLGKNVADIWDSETIQSDAQMGIAVPTRLRPLAKYFWKVKVWDQNGRESEWSPVAKFETGFLELSQWKAPWIQPSEFAVHFARKGFDVPPGKKIERARAYIAAAGGGSNTYVLYLNGQRVGDDLYAPGPCEPIKAMYSTYDVAPLLKEGLNTAALLYNRLVSVHVRIDFSDGSRQEIVTDRSWKGMKEGPYLGIGEYGTVGGGLQEIYDARKEPEGWHLKGFNDSGWTPISTIRTDANPENQWSPTNTEDYIYWTLKPGDCHEKVFPITVLKARKVPCREIARFSPVKIQSFGNGNYIVDFGQNAAGHVRFKASGARPGAEMEIHYGELLTPDGRHVDSSTTVRDAHQHFIFKDSREVVHQPLFFNTGFRFVEIFSYPGELTKEKIESIAVASDVLNGSSFECSSPVVNRLQNMARWSILSNLQNIPTDCPARERRGWTDEHLTSPGSNLNFDMRNFFEKWLDDHAECQFPSGWIPVELPMATDPHCDVKWPVSSIFIPWDVYQAYGDRYILEKNYPMMGRFMDFLAGASDSTLTPRYGDYGDWVAPEKAGARFLQIAFYYRCADLMSKISGLLEKGLDHTHYTNLAKLIRESILSNYRHKRSDGTIIFDNNSQSANAHALGFGIPDETERPVILQHLIDDYTRKARNTSGSLGIRWTLPVLTDEDRDEIAYSYVMNDTIGGWLYVVNTWDATTMHEVWNSARKYSHNHAFLTGCLTEWFYQGLTGITSQQPGFKEVRFKPYIPPDIDWVRAQINTARGWMKAEWKKTADGSLNLTVTLPANSRGTVYVPARDAGSVMESGRRVDKADGVRFVRMAGDRAVYAVGSGTYHFTSQLP